MKALLILKKVIAKSIIYFKIENTDANAILEKIFVKINDVVLKVVKPLSGI